MQATNLRDQFHLHGRKIIQFLLFGSLLFLFIPKAFAQRDEGINLVNYDDRFLHYGFQIGFHSSRYRLDYSQAFTEQVMDTVHSILPRSSPGFSVGFLINMRLAQYLDLRVLPKVGFYENVVRYSYTDGSYHEELRDPTMVEFPVMLKYKSQRRGNYRMYMIGGFNGMINAAGRREREDTRERLLVDIYNVALEFGAGLDRYYPYFKFSPEIRFSMGLIDILQDRRNSFSLGLDRVTTYNFTLYFTFEGGPS